MYKKSMNHHEMKSKKVELLRNYDSRMNELIMKYFNVQGLLAKEEDLKNHNFTNLKFVIENYSFRKEKI